VIEHIIDILQHQVGKENALTATEIAIELARRKIATTDREVRRTIAEAESAGTMPLLLGGRGGDGFYVAASYDELAERAESLWGQIQSLTKRLQSYMTAVSAAGVHIPIGERDANAIRTDRTKRANWRATALGIGPHSHSHRNQRREEAA